MILLADLKGRTDVPAFELLKMVDSPIPIVLVSRVEDYEFNPELLSLKDYVLMDYVELGWQWDQKNTHFWGENTHLFPDVFKSSDWQKFDDFVINNPPKLVFIRELLEIDRTEKEIPIEYPCWHPISSIQSKEQFNARKLELFHFWGHSHESRRIFQGNAYLHAVREDITIIDNIFYYQHFLQENHRRYWATMHIPHFARLPMNQILEINGNAKISLALSGAGVKCFRHSESPVNSVMLLPDDQLAWSTSWKHGINCIRCETGKEIEAIENALHNENLHDIYLAGMETVDKYRVNNYIQNYILPNIQKAV